MILVKATHKGVRSKTRGLRKNIREKGMPPLTKLLQEFNIGEKVHIKIDPSVHIGMPFRRFNGLTGTVIGKQGSCYLVEIKDQEKIKSVLAHPAHLIKLKE
ncbi:MAG: 50S ribosomal protein L21e [archaeon]